MMKPFKVYAISMVGILICCAIVISAVQKTNVSINRLIQKDNHFVYETSITSNYNSSNHAMVYKSKFASVKETYDYIDALNIKEISKDLKENQNYAILRYKNRDEVMIYESDNKDILVQVSDGEYVYRNGYGRMYRGMAYYSLLNTRYEREKRIGTIYTTRRTNSSSGTSSSSGGSARSSSFGSRPSSGGGTSFGK